MELGMMGDARSLLAAKGEAAEAAAENGDAEMAEAACSVLAANGEADTASERLGWGQSVMVGVRGIWLG